MKPHFLKNVVMLNLAGLFDLSRLACLHRSKKLFHLSDSLVSSDGAGIDSS